MYYSEKILEEVRAGNDIVDVISGYVRLQKKGGRYWASVLSTMRNPPPFP